MYFYYLNAIIGNISGFIMFTISASIHKYVYIFVLINLKPILSTSHLVHNHFSLSLIEIKYFLKDYDTFITQK